MSSDQVNYDTRPAKFYLYRDCIMRSNTGNAAIFQKRHLCQSFIANVSNVSDRILNMVISFPDFAFKWQNRVQRQVYIKCVY